VLVRSLVAVSAVAAAVACHEQSLNKRGPAGAPGEPGRDGRSCFAREVEGGIAIQCGDQPAFLLQKGQDGATGKNGADGRSCELLETRVDGLTIRCPDPKDPSKTRDITISNGKNGLDGKDGLNGRDGVNGSDGVAGANGKDGLSCSVSSVFGGGAFITCGSSQVYVPAGAAGAAGQNGEDNFTTTLGQVVIANNPLTMSSPEIVCSASLRTTDAYFGYRSKGAVLIRNDEVVQGLDSDYGSIVDGDLRFVFNNYIGLIKEGDSVACTMTIYADRSGTGVVSGAITTKGESTAVKVQKGEQALASGQDYRITKSELSSSQSADREYIYSLMLDLERSALVPMGSYDRCRATLSVSGYYTRSPGAVTSDSFFQVSQGFDLKASRANERLFFYPHKAGSWNETAVPSDAFVTKIVSYELRVKCYGDREAVPIKILGLQ
jgi:hypothetical protein